MVNSPEGVTDLGAFVGFYWLCLLGGIQTHTLCVCVSVCFPVCLLLVYLFLSFCLSPNLLQIQTHRELPSMQENNRVTCLSWSLLYIFPWTGEAEGKIVEVSL